jgi:hypothetical protein
MLATWEAETGKIKNGGQHRQIVHKTPISKITRAKWTGGVDQAVEYLLFEYKVLSSNPNPTKKINKKHIK